MNDPSVELSFDGPPDGMDDYVIDAPLPSSVPPTAAPPVKVPPVIAEEDEATEPEADSVAKEPPETPPEEPWRASRRGNFPDKPLRASRRGTFAPRGALAATATAKKKKKPFFTFPSDGYGRRHSAPVESSPVISEEDEATEPTEAAEKTAKKRTKPFWRLR